MMLLRLSVILKYNDFILTWIVGVVIKSLFIE
jgi:hypothetical protein